MFDEAKAILLLYLFIQTQSCFKTIGLDLRGNATQDQTSLRPNTLKDDADDIQRQLNNEARERLNGKPKTIWVFHLPTQVAESNSVTESSRKPRRSKLGELYKKWKYISPTQKIFTTQVIPITTYWDYLNQQNWANSFPLCNHRSQSPIDIIPKALIQTRGARPLQFFNFDVLPTELTLAIDENRVVMTGLWNSDSQPLIYGGAAHSRRYTFDSLTLHWPSEHTIGSMHYPLETQAIHISAEYNNFDEALNASERDPLAFLGIVTLYKYGNYTEDGLVDILETAEALVSGKGSTTVHVQPLEYFCPKLNKYACYQGSLTSPPCTESVLWFVRANSLFVTRDAVELAQKFYTDVIPVTGRQTQPLNDRKVYYFKT